MSANKAIAASAAALFLAGCDVADIGNLVPLRVVAPEVTVGAGGGVTCSYDPSGMGLPSIRMDVFDQAAMTIQVAARNNATDKIIPLRQNPQQTIQVPNSLQPLRFDYRWECDSSGFTADQGPLYVPAFSATRPFCIDNRDDATGNFVGFDIIPATGGAIAAGSTGLIETRIVTPQLSEGIRDTFELAVQADRCCTEVNGCENLDMADTTDPNTACGQLQTIFDRVAGTGQLSANNLEDVTRWRPFVTYTGQNGTGKTPVAYTMRLRGRYESITPAGDLVTSTEFAQEIGFCQGCNVGLAAFCLDI